MKLSESDLDTYKRIEKLGTMKDMFEWGVAVGRCELAKEQHKLIKELT